MKSMICFVLAVVTLSTVAAAKEPVNAPGAPGADFTVSSSMESSPLPATASFTTRRFEASHVDKKFASLSVISTGVTFADSYTTLFARQNWLAHKQGVCNEEIESAYLYGTHPTVARAYAVASIKSAGAIAAGYYLRKHHSKFWALPLVANSIIGTQGVAQNMVNCN